MRLFLISSHSCLVQRSPFQQLLLPRQASKNSIWPLSHSGKTRDAALFRNPLVHISSSNTRSFHFWPFCSTVSDTSGRAYIKRRKVIYERSFWCSGSPPRAFFALNFNFKSICNFFRTRSIHNLGKPKQLVSRKPNSSAKSQRHANTNLLRFFAGLLVGRCANVESVS